MLSSDEIVAILDAGYELRSVEFKGPGSTEDSAFVAKIARAAIALANQQDGGSIIIGLTEGTSVQSGLSATQINQWMDYDTVVDKINRYADPPLRITRAARALPGGTQVVVLEVAEFEEVPVLAARDFDKIIRRGQLYTRSFRKPESSAEHTQNEMRAVLDLATRKQLARFLELARAAGADLAGGTSDLERYDEEIRRFEAAANVHALTDYPHFRFVIRPDTYDSERVDYSRLQSLIVRNAVHLTGWPFPWASAPQHGESWAFERNNVMHPEAWVAFESGQFVSWHRLATDTPDDWKGLRENNEDDRFFAAWLPAREFTEVFTFSQRHIRDVAPDVSWTVTLELRGAQGWILVSGERGYGGFRDDYRLATNNWHRAVDISPYDAPRDPRDLAIAPSVHLLQRFGWHGVSGAVVKSMQDRIFGDRD